MSMPPAKKASERDGLIVRRAEPREAKAVAALILEAFSPFRDDYTPDAFAYTTPPVEIVRGRFSEGPILSAFKNGEMVGTVSGLPEPDRFYIRSMAVKPNAQRLGIGQRLLEALEGLAREAGYKKLYLYTTFVLPGARRLYERNGFYVLRETTPEEWCSMGGLEMEKLLD